MEICREHRVENQQFLFLIKDSFLTQHKQTMWRVYRHTRKDEDYTNYKEALNAATNEIR